MTATTYQHCYRVLRVAADCSPEELRLAYRRRVRSCHPDRMRDDATRDDEFKEVVKAYRTLVAFLRRHGELPPPWLVMASDAATANRAIDRRRTKARADAHAVLDDSRMRSAGRLTRFYAAVAGAFVLGVGTSALFGQAGERYDTGAASDGGQLVIGMDPQSVVELHGVPNYTKGSVWFYGDSGVIFERGCVIGWEDRSPFPLRALVSMTYLSRGATFERDGCTPSAN